MAASNFFELLTIFGALSEEVGRGASYGRVLGLVADQYTSNLLLQSSEKRTYAKWKAAEISRAIKEGRKPAPGPPGWDPEEEKRQAAAELSAEREAAQAVEEAKDDDDLLAREIARLTAPSGPVGETQGAKTDGDEPDGRQSTAAEEPADEGSPYGHAISPPPGVEEFSAADRRAPARLSFDAASGLNNSPSTPDKQTTGAVSPPTSNPSHSPNFSHPLRPQFQRGLSGSSPGGGSSAAPSAPSAPSSYFVNAPPAGGQGSPSLNATPGEVTSPGRPLPLTPQQLQERAQDPFATVQLPTSPPPPQKPQPQQPSAPAVSSQASQQMPTAPPLPSAPPAAAAAPPPLPTPASAPAPAPAPAAAVAAFPEVLSPQLTSKAQRLAKFAISALDYDDLETARRQLREALDVVEGRTTK